MRRFLSWEFWFFAVVYSALAFCAGQTAEWLVLR